MQTWGEAGVVKEGKNDKTGNRGIVMIFVGYPLNIDGDSYIMWKKPTSVVLMSQQDIFFKRTFFVPAVKLETIELRDISDVKLKSVDTAE